MPTYTINTFTLVLQHGNIIEAHTDAIVNAANAALAGGGGVDGAIHRAAGPTIMAACRKIGGCPTGSAVATTAGNLHAQYIFHAVGPIYGQHSDAPRLLASAHQACLDLAEHYQLKTIAFPALSTGAYGYPVALAAPIALKTILQHIQQPTTLQQIHFILFNDTIYNAYTQALTTLLAQS